MNTLYLACVVSFFITFVALGILLGIMESNRYYRKFVQAGMPTHVPPCCDAKKSAGQIGQFLLLRAKPAGRIFMSATVNYQGIENKVCSSVFEGECFDVVYLIRMCHAVGCELEVREVTLCDQDVVDDSVDAQEVISRMRDEWCD